MSFFIDTVGGKGSASKTIILPSSSKLSDGDEKDNFHVEPPSFVKRIFSHIENLSAEELKTEITTKITNVRSKNKNDINFEEECKNVGWIGKKKKGIDLVQTATKKLVNDAKNTDEVLKKSVITPDFEKQHSVSEYDPSERKLKAERKREREKTKGKKWYGLPATELTEEVKRDLEVLQMRSVLDPKQFYKKNDLKVLPKYFQIGKVMDSPLDYYSNRCTKKERKRTLVDELLADAEFNKYNKKRYVEIIQEKQKTHYKAFKQAKRLKRKNKK